MNEDKLRMNIKKSRESLNLSASDLAKKIGVSGQTVYDIESGKVQIKYGILLKIKAVFPELETGLETVFNNPVGGVIKEFQEKNINLSSSSSTTSKQAVQEKIGNGLIQIPEYDICLSAGGGSYPLDHALAIGERSFDPIWLNKKGLKPKNLALVRVQGDSMEPLLKDKDIIMVDNSKTIPNDASPFAVRVEESLYIKIIQKKKNILTLFSVNKTYEPIIINLEEDDCQVIGAVVWHAHSWV